MLETRRNSLKLNTTGYILAIKSPRDLQVGLFKARNSYRGSWRDPYSWRQTIVSIRWGIQPAENEAWITAF